MRSGESIVANQQSSTQQRQSRAAQRSVGIISIGAGFLTFFGLVVGLSAVGFAFDTFEDPATFIAIGPTAAGMIRWSQWLNMFGNYLLLIPLALYLQQWLRAEAPYTTNLFTLAGLAYLLLGAAGAAILAAGWSMIIAAYAEAATAQQSLLLDQFRLVTAIGESGLQGVIQNFCGAVWFLGMGSLLFKRRRWVAGFTLLLGLLQLCGMLGSMLTVELLTGLGLLATVLLIPLWAISLGTLFLLRPHEPHSVAAEQVAAEQVAGAT